MFRPDPCLCVFHPSPHEKLFISRVIMDACFFFLTIQFKPFPMFLPSILSHPPPFPLSHRSPGCRQRTVRYGGASRLGGQPAVGLGAPVEEGEVTGGAVWFLAAVLVQEPTPLGSLRPLRPTLTPTSTGGNAKPSQCMSRGRPLGPQPMAPQPWTPWQPACSPSTHPA